MTSGLQRAPDKPRRPAVSIARTYSEPLASDLRLVLTLLGEPPEGRVTLQEGARVHRVVSRDGRFVSNVALALSVPQQHQLLNARPLERVG
eukprot:scaffold3337_cov67-Phaeocystis_antarctica.AAC.7